MECCQRNTHEQPSGGCCPENRTHGWLSRKKQAETLREQLASLESRAEDIREYLRELEA